MMPLTMRHYAARPRHYHDHSRHFDADSSEARSHGVANGAAYAYHDGQHF